MFMFSKLKVYSSPTKVGRTPASTLQLALGTIFTNPSGMKPNVNRARCPYTEFAKFNNNLNVTGTVDFWFTSAPDGGDDGDVSIDSVAIIDVDHAEIGVPASGGGAIVTVWELYLADFREKFMMPRGGRLELGVLNPDLPASAGGISDSDESEDPNIGDTGGDDGGDSEGGNEEK